MIKNERQYRIAKAQAAKFEVALQTFGSTSRKDQATHPKLVKAQKEAIQSQLDSLNDELREYEELQSGKVTAPDLGYIAVVPRDLIRARIAAGLTQKDLAKRLGMAEQQIQQYEAKDYESVSLARIAEIANAIQPSKSPNRRLHR
jgi:DNA-binding XRE family transcriptional regulator